MALLADNGEVAEALLGAMANVGLQDGEGRNALHHCVQTQSYGSLENTWLLSALLRAPGGWQAAESADSKGVTPCQLAARQGSKRMASVLTSAGLVLGSSDKPAAPPPEEKPDVESDARAELERVESSAKPLAIPVHKAYSMSGENRVWAESEGEDCDALLFKVDLKRDEMRFYHLQLVYETNKDLFVLFTRWGEIGETGMFQRTPAENKDAGLKEFCKVFREKTGNVWSPTDMVFERKPNKYQLLKRRRATARSDELLQAFDLSKSPSSKLPYKLLRTLDSICDPMHVLQALNALGVKTQCMPFGTLSRNTLDEARILLGQIKLAHAELQTIKSDRARPRAFTAEDVLEVAKRKNIAREKILDLSSRYFELVPRGAGTIEVARPIDTDKALGKEFDTLLNLTEASVGVQLLLAAHRRTKEVCPLDYCKQALGVSFQEVNSETEEFRLLFEYMQNTCDSNAPPKLAEPGDIPEAAGAKRSRRTAQRQHDTVTAVYRLVRGGENERFRELGNRRLLWHGSRRSNLIGILSQGLRVAPSEAPVSGYMFGKGIYFADMYCKSRQYCAGSKTEPTYMLLCEVALGDMFPSRQACYMEEPRPGTSSTWGVGQKAPDWGKKRLYEPGGAALPCGKLDGGPLGGQQRHGLNYNEFIVYDPAQVRVRYLVELNNFECPSEVMARKTEAEALAAKEAAARGLKRARLTTGTTEGCERDTRSESPEERGSNPLLPSDDEEEDQESEPESE